MKSILLAGAALAVSIGVAAAADSVTTAPAGFVWTGGYVGLQAGYAWGNANYDAFEYATIDYDPDGFFGGLYVGYNHQLHNNIVLGIDADLNFSGIDGKARMTWFGDPEPDEEHVGYSKVKTTAAIRGRLGYAMDRFMPYVAGGVSSAKYQFDLDHDGTGNMDFEEERRLTGWNVGVGAEYAVTNNILVRAEYRYTDFGSENFDQDWGGDSTIDLKTHDVRLGVAYKF
jgi:outer membrane immunogenic protein